MTLQELYDCAVNDQWFPISYRGPLQSYLKRYAKALGHEVTTCPPTVYHLPDTRVAEVILASADPALQHRSVQAGINAIVQLLHRAVKAHCLTPWTSPLVPISNLHGRKNHRDLGLLHRIPHRQNNSRYALMPWPAALAYDAAMYSQWCRQEVVRGRPAKIRKGENSLRMVENIIGEIAAYAVDVQGIPKDEVLLPTLCQPAFLEEYAWWWINRRGLSTSTILKNLAVMKTIVRYWVKDEESAKGIIEVIKRLKNEAPAHLVLDKEARELSLTELHDLAQSLYPLNALRVQQDYRVRAIARYLDHPDTTPLKPYHKGIRNQVSWAGLSLIINLLIHRPLRIGNIANLEFRHLRSLPQGGYEIVIPKSEMKNGKYMKRAEWRERFPTRLLPALEQWLTCWRPHVVKSGETPSSIFLNARGRRYDVTLLSSNIGVMTVRLTQQRDGGPIAWFPHMIRTTWTKEMLYAGLNPYIVQRIMGDSFHVIDQHYGGHQDRLTSSFARQLAKEIGEGID